MAKRQSEHPLTCTQGSRQWRSTRMMVSPHTKEEVSCSPHEPCNSQGAALLPHKSTSFIMSFTSIETSSFASRTAGGFSKGTKRKQTSNELLGPPLPNPPPVEEPSDGQVFCAARQVSLLWPLHPGPAVPACHSARSRR